MSDAAEETAASAADVLAAMASETKTPEQLEQEKAEKEEKEILDRLTKTYKPAKKRKPGSRWDGRYSSLNLQEYRELKWGVDNGYARTTKGSPLFTMRGALPNPSLPDPKDVKYKPERKVFVRGDLHQSMTSVKYTGPSYSMGCLPVISFKPMDKSPGPAQYKIQSCMDPVRHPTNKKDCGVRFGSGTLTASDPGPVLPGPGQYECTGFERSSVQKKSPQYTVQGREAWFAKTAPPGPGVGEYDVFKAMRTGKISSIEWTAQGKTMPIEPARGHERQCENPPPNAYNPPTFPTGKNPNKPYEPTYSFAKEARGLI
eukprot:TRINITY_DN32999_c0_g1_i1.p1 TRINITY_DN32999_c0_g1~~TRINITY_DN32999_c0_g1_i1.p1  ORF type:complete len:315 (+),score=44.21 TRINITY_DN32999_c0_g1_i1:93-1037(+)